MKLNKLAKFAISGLLAICMIGCGAKPAAQKVGANPYYPGTQTSQLPNYPYAPMVFTATSQTLTQTLGGVSYITISLTEATITTLTFQVLASNDGGVTYYPLSVAPYVSGTLVPVTTAVTVTSGASHLYVANVASFTNFEIVTSGTFTATGVSFQVTGSSNPGLVLNIG